MINSFFVVSDRRGLAWNSFARNSQPPTQDSRVLSMQIGTNKAPEDLCGPLIGFK